MTRISTGAGRFQLQPELLLNGRKMDGPPLLWPSSSASSRPDIESGWNPGSIDDGPPQLIG
ncbi:MAG TPA: hypothetical protein VHW24_13300 [Bryobacteraceae bacterium]|nr:hypothetical protein [Bryobacteraceae bacterium]